MVPYSHKYFKWSITIWMYEPSFNNYSFPHTFSKGDVTHTHVHMKDYMHVIFPLSWTQHSIKKLWDGNTAQRTCKRKEKAGTLRSFISIDTAFDPFSGLQTQDTTISCRGRPFHIPPPNQNIWLQIFWILEKQSQSYWVILMLNILHAYVLQVMKGATTYCRWWIITALSWRTRGDIKILSFIERRKIYGICTKFHNQQILPEHILVCLGFFLESISLLIPFSS